jgi:hypothetical protein
MKISLATLGMALCLLLGLLAAQRTADARAAVAPAPVPMAKSCSFQSDCPYGTCKNGQCGGCSFQSDCKGWGICKDGQCGGCNFQSECQGFGACQSGRCEKSPY